MIWHDVINNSITEQKQLLLYHKSSQPPHPRPAGSNPKEN